MAVLITGASTGIGRELARVFAQNGHELVLTARSGAQLESAAAECLSLGAPKARILVKDLSLPDSPREIFDELNRDGVSIDVLVNNAGFGAHGLFAATDLDDDLAMLQVNVVSLTALTRLFVGPMLAAGRGRILNLASVAAFVPGPYMAIYFASKAYVLHFSEAVAQEVAKRGVSVTALCPGPVNTEFQKRAGIAGSRLFKDGVAMTPAKVALAGYRGLMRGRRVVIPGASNWWTTQAVRFSPRRLATFMAGALNKLH